MKKIITLILASALLLTCMSTSLAVTATYHEGKVTVTTGNEGFYEIWIDGVGSGYWVGTGRPSNTFSIELADGQHTVRLYSPDGDGSETDTFWVGAEVTEGPTEEPTVEPTEEPTVEPTEEPIVEPTAEPEEKEKEPKPTENASTVPSENEIEHLPIEAAAIVKEPTCTETGLDSNNAAVPALGHLYRADKKDGDNIEYRCIRCDNTMKAGQYSMVKDRLGSIVTDADKNVVSYQAYAKKDTPKIYYIKPEKSGELTLTLDSNVIVTLMREGFDRVAFLNGNDELIMNMNYISKKWFDTDERINCYQIVTDPYAEGGKLVKFYAVTDTEIISATYFLDVQLNGEDLFMNGVY